MKEKLQELRDLLNQVYPIVDTFETVEEFTSKQGSGQPEEVVNAGFVSLALNDLASYLKDLIRFETSNYPFSDDLKENIRSTTRYLSENFDSFYDRIEETYNQKGGMEIATGRIIDIKAIINSTIENATKSAQILLRRG